MIKNLNSNFSIIQYIIEQIYKEDKELATVILRKVSQYLNDEYYKGFVNKKQKAGVLPRKESHTSQQHPDKSVLNSAEANAIE